MNDEDLVVRAAASAGPGLPVLRAKTVRDLREVLATTRASDRPTGVYVEGAMDDTVSSPPQTQTWWDVPVAGTGTRPSAVRAREEYDLQVMTRRRHL